MSAEREAEAREALVARIAVDVLGVNPMGARVRLYAEDGRNPRGDLAQAFDAYRAALLADVRERVAGMVLPSGACYCASTSPSPCDCNAAQYNAALTTALSTLDAMVRGA
jgi:hypothetical protein